MSVPLGVTLGD